MLAPTFCVPRFTCAQTDEADTTTQYSSRPSMNEYNNSSLPHSLQAHLHGAALPRDTDRLDHHTEWNLNQLALECLSSLAGTVGSGRTLPRLKRRQSPTTKNNYNIRTAVLLHLKKLGGEVFFRRTFNSHSPPLSTKTTAQQKVWHDQRWRVAHCLP